MNDVAKLTVTVLQRISEFLQTLPEDQLTDIAEGRATLTYHPFGAARPTAPSRRPPSRIAKPKKDMSEVSATLGRMTSRDEGERFLGSLTATDVKALAAELGMRGVSKDRKDDLIAKIVERTIGARLDSAAIRQL
jgi:Rho termination factor, N-terminal domain